MAERLRINDLDKVIASLEKAGFDKGLWKTLGRKLGLYPNTLGVISRDNGDVNSCYTECLSQWLRRADGVDEVGEPSYDILANALDKMDGCKDPADAIRDLTRERHTLGEKNAEGYVLKKTLSEETKSAKSTRPETDSPATTNTTGAANKEGGAQGSAGDEETDGPAPPPQDAVNVNEWLKESKVNLNVERVLMHGLPGSGKTCSQHLLLNKPPPKELVTDSTGIACRAVKATRMSANDDRMEEINVKALLSSLAHDLKEAAAKQKKSPPEEDHSTEPMEEFSEAKTTEPAELVAESGEATDTTETEDAADDTEANEIIDKIVKHIPEAEGRFDSNWVYFIDSGGQTAFQELLPLFTRASSFNIITLDISKDIDKELEQKYRINEKFLDQIHESSADDSKPFSCTNIQFLKDVLSSGSILQPYQAPQAIEPEENTSTESTDPQCPGYFVLGTHKDKADEGVIKKYNDELKKLESESKEKGYCIIPAELSGKIIYAVDTLESGTKREEEATKLCKIIYNQVSRDEVRIDLPVRWFAFELTLLEKADRKGQSFLPMDDVLLAGKRLQMNKAQTKEALEYLHNNTLILYYPQVLRDVVFVDPHPILDILSRLLALATYQIPQDDLDHFVKKGKLSEPELNNLTLRGLFTEVLLEKLKDDKDFPKSDFIELLLHLHIVVKIDEKDEYFLPSALPPCPKTRLPPKSDIDPLQIIWCSPVTNEGSRQILPIPRGIFSLVVIKLMKRIKRLQFRFPPISSEYLRYRDAMSFRVHYQDAHIGTVHIIKKHKHIEIYFEGDASKYCSLICKAVKEAIASSCKAINIKPDGYELAFACPSSTNVCYRIVTDEVKKKVECTTSTTPPIVSGKEKYWSWFDQKSLTIDLFETFFSDDVDIEFKVLDDATQDNTAPAPTTPDDGATSTVGADKVLKKPKLLEDVEVDPKEFSIDLAKGINILLMTATEVELRGVLGYLKPLDGRNKVIETVTPPKAGSEKVYIGKYGQYPVVVGISAPTKDKQGPISAALVTEHIMRAFKPCFVIAIGICYTVDREKFSFCDVAVSSMVCDLTSLRVGEKWLSRRGTISTGEILLNAFYPPTGFKVFRPPDHKQVRVYSGAFISRGDLVDDSAYKEKLKELSGPDAIAGEMEGAGIMAAIKKPPYRDRMVEAIIIKAFSDNADGNKDKDRDWKDFAADAVARYVHYQMDKDNGALISCESETDEPNTCCALL